MKLIPWTVNSITTKAPTPLPNKINGTDRVKAKAPITPSIENEASRISKYRILLQALKFEFGLNNSFSFSSEFFLKPSVIKKAVAPIEADKAKIGLTVTEK